MEAPVKGKLEKTIYKESIKQVNDDQLNWHEMFSEKDQDCDISAILHLH